MATIHRLDNLGDRGLDREQAAKHLGLCLGDFDYHVRIGRIAAPIARGGRLIWPVQNLLLRRRRPAAERGHERGVYVVGFDNYIKIGMSADVTRRLAEIQDWLPVQIAVHEVFAGVGREGEKVAHDRFAEYRLRGEWFRNDGSLAEWIRSGCS